ncbi:MAG: ABC transporter ATP-binding protein [Defluviitaleaceae bacterium]|nr:ABC transporter ATP-binding protein [Defluviitaleaceae bacterium]
MNTLEIINLTKSYKNFSIKNINMTIPKNTIMGFVGPNGAGKTTLLKSILGISKYDSGTIKFFGNDTKYINSDVGSVMDFVVYEERWKVSGVEKFVKPYHENWDASRFDNLLKQFSIDKSKKVKELSRGMSVKLMLAVALSHNAKILILDEPTSGLDITARDEICNLLLDYVKIGGRSVLFSTHIVEDIEKIANDVTYIANGSIVISDTKESLLTNYLNIEGSLDKITGDFLNIIIGSKRYSDRFKAIIHKENLSKIANGLDISNANLSDLAICFNNEQNTVI